MNCEISQLHKGRYTCCNFNNLNSLTEESEAGNTTLDTTAADADDDGEPAPKKMKKKKKKKSKGDDE